MKYSNINIDRAPLSQADVAKGQNFAKLLKQTAPTPWYQTSWFYVTAGIAAAGIVVASIFVLPALKGEEAMASQHQKDDPVVLADSLNSMLEPTPVINPPFGDIKSWTTLQVDASAGGTFEAGSSIITIPAYSFADENGVPVSGVVELKYREFTDKVDLLISGIPMEYDSAGTAYTFETAGMFELRGTQKGKGLCIAQGKTLDVVMSSDNTGAEFNQYVLDETTGDWDFLGAQETMNLEEDNFLETEAENTDVLDLAIEEEEPLFTGIVDSATTEIQLVEKPAALPRKADPDKFQIEIDYDEQAFPELAAYDGVLFELYEEDVAQAKKEAQQAWNEVNIERKASGYWLTFRRGSESYQVHAYPVIPSDKMATAEANFKKRQQAYMKKVDERRAAESRAREIRQQNRQQNRQRTMQLNTETRVQRAFAVARFGIFNSDCPRNLPQGAVVQATYASPEGVLLANATGTQHLVELDREIMYNLYGGMDLQFNPRKINMVWITTTDQRLAVVSPEQLDQVRGRTASFQCQLSEPIQDEEALRFFLKPYLTGEAFASE